MDTEQITLFGVPIDLGAENLGVSIGPDAFRHQMIVEKLASVGFEVNDAGNIKVRDHHELTVGDPRLRYLEEVVRVNEEVATKVEAAIKANHRTIVLGGDSSICLGAVSGASVALNGELGLIYFDAHGDMNTDKTTLTGNIHGMQVAALMGFGNPALSQLHGQDIKVRKENLLHIGASNFDKAELEFIEREHIHMFTLFDLLSQGLAAAFAKIDALAARVPNLWVSVDLDVIDRLYAPGAGMPNNKGLSYREIAVLAEYIGQKANVVGLDIVEYSPLQDEQRKTAELGIELITTFLGHNYSWYTGYLEEHRIG
ncbi:MAG TPA: arginase [Candidatus Saccharimonadales bacterium]|nr:arginase [Candidatus Saccharimonadales bacterium]